MKREIKVGNRGSRKDCIISKKADSEVSPDNSGSALESKRKQKPNSFIYGKDFDCSWGK